MIRPALSATGPGWQTRSRTAIDWNQKQEQGTERGPQAAPPDRNVGIPQVRSVRICFLLEVPVCVTHSDISRGFPGIRERGTALKRNACSCALCALEPAGALPSCRPRSSLISVFLPCRRITPAMCNSRCRRLHPPTRPRPPRAEPGSSIQGQARRMPAAMTALPSTILRRTSLITGTPVNHAANQPVNPRAKRMATKVNASSSPRGSHVIAASRMTAPIPKQRPAVKAARTVPLVGREPQDAVPRRRGPPPDPVR